MSTLPIFDPLPPALSALEIEMDETSCCARRVHTVVYLSMGYCPLACGEVRAIIRHHYYTSLCLCVF